MSLPGAATLPDTSLNVFFSFARRVGRDDIRTTAFVRYSADTITVTTGAAGAAVPEPQIWAMLVIGFGVTGGTLRQGRRARPKAVLAA